MATHFGDNLLCRIHAQAGNLSRALHGSLMLSEQSRHLLVKLTDVLLDELQPLVFWRCLGQNGLLGVKRWPRAMSQKLVCR
jgi:hypothetical protein